MRRSLPDFALKRPITVVMLLLLVLGMGGIALTRIPVELIPKLDFPHIGCYIPYPGATPAQVENEIAIPAEGEFRTLAHLKRIRTTSDSDGCSVNLQFTWDADMSVAASEVRARMERLKMKLPREIERLFLRRFSSDSMPVMVFTMVWNRNEEELTHLVRTLFQPRIMRIEGVAEVTVMGREEAEVLVEFDQNALRTHRLGLYQVVTTLQSSSLNMAVGRMVEDNTKYYVRVLDEFTEPQQIANLIVGPNALRLKDVARVGFRAREVDRDYSFDGKRGVFLMVRKESEANTIDVCRQIQAEMDRLKTDPVFEGTEVFVFFDQGKAIMSALSSLVDSGKYGGALAIGVLFLFLWRIRPTLLVALCIPASVVVAFVYMFFAGMTLNLITMISLIIALGMLVDNAIVVIENITRYQAMGLPPMESARRGATEVGLAITASTITTIVVFIPMFYMETGEMAIYMRQFAAPITAALIASLIIALTMIPLAMSRMRTREQLLATGPVQQAVDIHHRVFGARYYKPLAYLSRLKPQKQFINLYVTVLRRTLLNRTAAILFVLCALGITYAIPFRNVGMQDMPTVDTRAVNIRVIFEQNFDMNMAKDTFAKIQNAIDQQRKELGIKNIFLNYGPDGGDVRVYLRASDEYPPGESPPYSTEHVLDILWLRMPARLPGVELRFSIAESSEGQTRTVSLRMRGGDAALLNAYADQFKELMKESIPELGDVVTDTNRDKEEMQLHIDEALADRAQVSAVSIAQTVDFALRGIRLPYLKHGGREIPVWAQFREEDRKTRANLDNVLVVSPTGSLIPLNQLVTVAKAQSPKSIQRVNSKNVVTIQAQVHSTEDLAAISEKLKMLRDSFSLPVGYSIEMGDEFMELADNLASFAMAVSLAVILIYLVMGALFESYILPLSILTSVPLSFIGVYWAMYLTGTPMDTIAYIGLVLMVGVVVNNGIVIVDHMNHLRNQGMERFEATIQAGRDRCRPVMMTTLTTILGCVPLALGGGMGSEVSFASLGRALIGGMTSGTLLTLVVVPLFYSLIDDLRAWFLHYLGDMTALFRRSPPASSKAG